jgi:magnesium chelatase family protein
MNPRRCGGGPGHACKRGPRCAADYQSRISGPFLHRIDLTIEVPAVTAADLCLPAPAEGSEEVRSRVIEARGRQARRLDDIEGARARTNAELSGTLLDRVASPDPEGLALLRQAADTLSLSARGFHRTLRVARTLADLEASPNVARHHIAEALGYRAERLGSQRQAA